VPDFFVLVLDKYAAADPTAWVYSATAETKAALLALRCYDEPPHKVSRADYNGASEGRMSLAPCAGGPPDPGTIYGLTGV